MFVISFGTRSEGGGWGAVSGDMHLVPNKDHCNTGCNLDTRTTEGTPRKKENENDLRVVVGSEAKVRMQSEAKRDAVERAKPRGSQARLAQ